MEQKGIKALFRGTTRSKADNALYPGNPNSQEYGISTSTDPVKATIFAIESATKFGNYKGVLQIGLPVDLKDLKLTAPNNRVHIELEAIIKTSAENFSKMSQVEISVDDARKLIKEVYGINLPSSIDDTTEARVLLETLKTSSLEQSFDFYKKAIKYNAK